MFSLPPSHQLPLEHMAVLTGVPTGVWWCVCVCACACVCMHAVAERFVWVCIHTSLQSSIPTSEAIQFPRMLQRLSPPVLQHAHTRAHTLSHTLCLLLDGRSIIFTLAAGAVCKHRGLVDTKIQLCRLAALSRAVC